MTEPRTAGSPLREQVEAAIRDFPFDNYGMDDVSYALEGDPDGQDWVPALARAVLKVFGQRAEAEAAGGES